MSLISNLKKTITLSVLTTSAFAGSYAVEPTFGDLYEAMKSGKPDLEFRLRNETYSINQTGVQSSHATTLRTKLGYTTADFYETTARLEMVHVSSYLTTRYNPDVDGLRKSQYAVIPDPKGAGLTQAYIQYRGLEATEIRFGRQRLAFDNERFISDINWRQYPQSFNALTVSNQFIADLDLFYGLLTQQYHTSSNARTEKAYSIRSHLIRGEWSGIENTKVLGYLYFHHDNDNPMQSNLTTGIRFTTDYPVNETNQFGYVAEFARQRDRNNNPVRYRANYYHLKVHATSDIYHGAIGYEHFGSDGGSNGKQFKMPLGNGHTTMGALDVFDPIPARGIRDLYVSMGVSLSGFEFGASWHNFYYVQGGAEKKPGLEIDLDLGYHLNDHVDLGISYGDFYPKSGGGVPKTKKLWFTASLYI